MIEEKGDNVWRVRSPNPGVHLLIFGGVHGNERTGIEAVEHFRDAFSSGALSLTSGALTLAIANTRAAARNDRWIEGRNLNRYFSDAHLLKRVEASWEEGRAIELASLCQEADLLIDIHATNKPSVPFACSRIDAAHERIYRWFGVKNVIEDPEYVFGGGPVTTDEYMDRIGNVGVCIEAGYVNDPDQTPRTIRAITNVMIDHGLLEGALPPVPPLPNRYRFDQAIRLDECGFSFAPHMGEHSFQSTRAGETLGYRGEEPVVMEKDGVIVFPKLPHHFQLREPVCFIAVPV